MHSTKLTDWERHGLEAHWNLADGHARQSPTAAERLIWNSLGEISAEAEKARQSDLEDMFSSCFFDLNGQIKGSSQCPRPLFLYSCSVAIEVVANYLKRHNSRVALLTPTFDNLSDILHRLQVDLQCIKECEVTPEHLSSRRIDTLFLVLPNNPTGWELTNDSFARIVEICAERDILLVIDFSFRLFSEMATWDQYAILSKSGVRFICLEDTGKFFSTLDLKVGLLVSSQSLHSQLRALVDDVLLNVSPLILMFLTRIVKQRLRDGAGEYVELLAKNSDTLTRVLRPYGICPSMASTAFSVMWCTLPNHMDATVFAQDLLAEGIAILPGGPFHWDNPKDAERCIRLALMRDVTYVRQAADRLKNVLPRLTTN